MILVAHTKEQLHDQGDYGKQELCLKKKTQEISLTNDVNPNGNCVNDGILKLITQ